MRVTNQRAPQGAAALKSPRKRVIPVSWLVLLVLLAANAVFAAM